MTRATGILGGLVIAGTLALHAAIHFSPTEQEEPLPLAIWREGESIPTGYGSHVSGGFKAGRDVAISYSGDTLVLRPLERIKLPCGDEAIDPLDPSPGNVWVPCRSILRLDDQVTGQLAQRILILGGDIGVKIGSAQQ